MGNWSIQKLEREGELWSRYEAQHKSGSGRRYAAFRFARAMVTEVRQTQGMIRELEALAAVKHPGLAPIEAAGMDENVLTVVASLPQGMTLEERLKTRGALEPAEAASVVTQVGASLDALHAQRPAIVFRSLSPAQVFLADDGGRVLLLEAGFAHALRASRLEPDGTSLRAPPPFRAPEDDVTSWPLLGSVDQFALASIAFTCVHGSPPFPEDAAEAERLTRGVTRPSLTSNRPDLPFELDTVLRKGLSALPNHRYASCGAFGAEFARVMQAARPRRAGPVSIPAPKLDRRPTDGWGNDSLTKARDAALASIAESTLGRASTSSPPSGAITSSSPPSGATASSPPSGATTSSGPPRGATTSSSPPSTGGAKIAAGRLSERPDFSSTWDRFTPDEPKAAAAAEREDTEPRMSERDFASTWDRFSPDDTRAAIAAAREAAAEEERERGRTVDYALPDEPTRPGRSPLVRRDTPPAKPDPALLAALAMVAPTTRAEVEPSTPAKGTTAAPTDPGFTSRTEGLAEAIVFAEVTPRGEDARRADAALQASIQSPTRDSKRAADAHATSSSDLRETLPYAEGLVPRSAPPPAANSATASAPSPAPSPASVRPPVADATPSAPQTSTAPAPHAAPTPAPAPAPATPSVRPPSMRPPAQSTVLEPAAPSAPRSRIGTPAVLLIAAFLVGAGTFAAHRWLSSRRVPAPSITSSPTAHEASHGAATPHAEPATTQATAPAEPTPDVTMNEAPAAPAASPSAPQRPSTTVATPATTSAEPLLRPTPEQRQAARDQIEAGITRCVREHGPVNQRLYLEVTYQGASGRVVGLWWGGPGFAQHPVTPCILDAVRTVALPPFRDARWVTRYNFLVI